MCNFFKNFWFSFWKFVQMLLEPIVLLPESLPQLFKWMLVTFVVGSSTIWIPYLIFLLGNQEEKTKELAQLLGTNLMAFFVLIISERVSVLVSTPGDSEKDNSATIKGVAVVMSIILILVCNSVYVAKKIYTTADTSYYHWWIVGLAFVLVIYLFSLTSSTRWKALVDNNYAKTEENEVAELSKKSEESVASSDGVKL